MATPEEPSKDSPMRSLADDDGLCAPGETKELSAATLVREGSEIKLVSLEGDKFSEKVGPTLVESDSNHESENPRSGDATTANRDVTTTDNGVQDATIGKSEPTDAPTTLDEAAAADLESGADETKGSVADLESGATTTPPPLPPGDDGSMRLKEVWDRLTGPKLKVWLILAATLFAIFLFRSLSPALSYATTAMGNYGLSEWLYSVQLGPKHQDYFDLGAAYEKRGDIANAERLYRKAAPHFERYKSDHFALTMGAILDKQKKFAEADTYYADIENRTNKRLIYSQSKYQGSRSRIDTDTSFAQGKVRVIALPRLLRLISQIPPDVRGKHFSWAQPYWNRKELSKNSPAIAEMVQIDLRPITTNLRSDMNSRERPQSKGPLSPPLSSEAVAANEKGNTLGSTGHKQEAIRCFDQVIMEAPLRAVGYVNKALTQRRMHDNIAALRTLDQGIDRVPKDAELYLLRGNVLSDLGKYEEARADFYTGYALDPEMGHLYDRGKTIRSAQLADYLRAIGKDEALKHPFTAKLAKDFFPEKGSNLLLKSDVSGEQLGRNLYPASPQDLVQEHYFMMDHRDFYAMEALAKQTKKVSSAD